jgi:hypothetical protein
MGGPRWVRRHCLHEVQEQFRAHTTRNFSIFGTRGAGERRGARGEGVFAALTLAKNVAARWFVHAVAVGVAWGMLNAIVQCTLFDIYAQHNAHALEAFKGRPSPIPVRYFFLLMGPLVGAATGLVLGAMTFVLRKLLGEPG